MIISRTPFRHTSLDPEAAPTEPGPAPASSSTVNARRTTGRPDEKRPTRSD
jgi:hypothetical protein